MVFSCTKVEVAIKSFREAAIVLVSNTVPFNDLGRIDSVKKTSLKEAFNRVLESGLYVLGPEHDAFELELARYVGVRYALGCANGTDAIQIALRAMGVVAGDTVVTAANAGGYTTTAASLIGAKVAFADVDIKSHLLTVETLKELVSALPVLPRVIVVTHLYGAAAPVREIVKWSNSLGILVLEDCAQALGAFDGSLKVGSIGHASTTSFYPTKNLGALGDAGAVMTNNADVAEKVLALRQYGWASKYNSTVPLGTNSRLDEVQAGFLRIGLGALDANNERRREIHTRYFLSGSSALRFVNQANPGFVAHLAVVEALDRKNVVEHFKSLGVSTAIHYPVPDHLQISLGIFSNPVPLSNTELLAERVLSLPLFPELTEHEIDIVCRAIVDLG
jgi:aminotransferase EvaB